MDSEVGEDDTRDSENKENENNLYDVFINISTISGGPTSSRQSGG